MIKTSFFAKSRVLDVQNVKKMTFLWNSIPAWGVFFASPLCTRIRVHLYFLCTKGLFSVYFEKKCFRYPLNPTARVPTGRRNRSKKQLNNVLFSMSTPLLPLPPLWYPGITGSLFQPLKLSNPASNSHRLFKRSHCFDLINHNFNHPHHEPDKILLENFKQKAIGLMRFQFFFEIINFFQNLFQNYINQRFIHALLRWTMC